MRKNVYKDCRSLKNVKQLPYVVREANQEGTPVLLNLSSRVKTLGDLMRLSQYYYYWEKENIKVLVGKVDNGRVSIDGKLSKRHFNMLYTYVSKPTYVHKFGGAKKEFLDLRNVKSVYRTLVSISNLKGFEKEIKSYDTFGPDNRRFRDVYGLYREYTVSAYDKVQTVVPIGTKWRDVKDFTARFEIYKIINGKPEKFTIEAFRKYFNKKNKEFFFDKYRKEITKMDGFPIEKIKDYARVVGLDPNDYSEEELKGVMGSYSEMKGSMSKYLDTTLSTEFLVSIADRYQDRALADNIYKLLLAGVLKIDSDGEENPLTSYSIMKGYDYTGLYLFNKIDIDPDWIGVNDEEEYDNSSLLG